MNIRVSIDNTRLLRRLEGSEKRIAFAVVNALNASARKVQEVERSETLHDFTVRKKEFILREAAIIKPFASVGKGVPYVEIAVGQKARLLLSEFETGGRREPFTGRRVAVPLIGGPARPSFAAQVPAPYTFKGLKIVAVREGGAPDRARGRRHSIRRSADVTFHAFATKGGGIQYKGALRTFILLQTSKAPSGGVFQRIGPGRDDIRMIYSFVGQEELRRRLHFVDVAETTARIWLPAYLDQEVARALARHANE